MEKHCQISFSENSFIVSGICADSITIDTTGDINVTSLVENLIHLIDTEDCIVLETQEDASWDDKKQMIYKLVCKIFEKYNKCIAEDNNDFEAAHDRDFASVTVSNDNGSVISNVNSDDLPF